MRKLAIPPLYAVLARKLPPTAGGRGRSGPPRREPNDGSDDEDDEDEQHDTLRQIAVRNAVKPVRIEANDVKNAFGVGQTRFCTMTKTVLHYDWSGSARNNWTAGQKAFACATLAVFDRWGITE